MYIVPFVTLVSPYVREHFWDSYILLDHPLIQNPFKVIWDPFIYVFIYLHFPQHLLAPWEHLHSLSSEW